MLRPNLPILLGFALLGGPALGQQVDGSVAGFALDRFAISERGSDWFVLDSLDLRGHLRAAVGLGADWARRPLVLYDEEGQEQHALVSQQLVNHLGASLVLWDRLRVAVDLPFVLYQTGESGELTSTTFQPPDSSAVGDLRLGADVRLLGVYRSPLSIAVGAQLELPTGDQASFAGDGKVRVTLRAQAAGELGPVAWAVKAAYLHRGQDAPVDGAAYGSELAGAAGVGVRLFDARLLVGAELHGSSVLEKVFERRTSVMELLVGGHLRVGDDWRVGVGAGPGLARGYGTPAARVVASVEWAPRPRAADRVVPREIVAVAAEPPSRPSEPPPPPLKPVLEPTTPASSAPAPAPDDGAIANGRIRMLEQVRFGFNSDRILPVSEPGLEVVVAVMLEHLEITHVTVRGHTDGVGGKAYNQRLSTRRARSVMDWLVKRGIAHQRLAFEGKGMENPLDSNDTETGRQNNRRVELMIDEQVMPPGD